MENNQISCTGLLTCERTEMDDNLGSLSLHGIVHRLFVALGDEGDALVGKKIIRVQNPIEIVVFWKRSGGLSKKTDIPFTVEFVDPKGKVLFGDIEGNILFKNGERRHYSIIAIPNGLVCTVPGIYTFRVKSKDVTKSESDVLYEETFEIIIEDSLGNVLPV